MRSGLLPFIILRDEGVLFALHLCAVFEFLTAWGSVHVGETVVGWHGLLRLKTSAY